MEELQWQQANKPGKYWLQTSKGRRIELGVGVKFCWGCCDKYEALVFRSVPSKWKYNTMGSTPHPITTSPAEKPVPIFHSPFQALKASIRPLWNLFCQLNNLNSFTFQSQERCSVQLLIFVPLLWSCSNRSMPSVCCGPPQLDTVLQLGSISENSKDCHIQDHGMRVRISNTVTK